MKYKTNKKEMLESLGEVIWYKRRRLKITQKDLSQRVNVSNNAMNRVETGKGAPGAFFLLRVANELDLKLEDLIPVVVNRNEDNF